MMEMLRKIRQKKTTNKHLQQQVDDLQQENKFLRKRLLSMSTEVVDERQQHSRGRVNPFEITVPAFCISDVPTATVETPIPSSDSESSLSSSLSSIQQHDLGTRLDEEREMPSIESFRADMVESRQDSFSLPRESSVEHHEDLLLRTRSVSTVRQLPPLPDNTGDIAAADCRRGSNLFRDKQQRNTFNSKSHTFMLRPKSIVFKWNRYADMEDDGYAVAPRLRTKLAKARQKKVSETLHNNGATRDAPQETTDKVVNLQRMEKANNFATIPNHGTTRDVPDNATDLVLGSESVEQIIESQGQDDGVTRATHDETNSVHVDSRNMEEFNDPPTLGEGATRDASDESTGANSETIEEVIDLTPTDPTKSENGTTKRGFESIHNCFKDKNLQQELVKLSLAQILIQSYQPDPEDPGWWIGKANNLEQKEMPKSEAKPSSSYANEDRHTQAPKPTLNSFLAEVKTRRNEIMGKSIGNCDGKDLKEGESEGNPEFTSCKLAGLGATKQKECFVASFRVTKDETRLGSVNNLLIELKAKQKERRGKFQTRKMRSSSKSAMNTKVGLSSTILDELKVKQKERMERKQEK
jgi:hypothetical protein